MRKLAIAAALAGTFGFAAPALAGPGQCYDAYGRPIGPVYDTDYPNYSFINSVVRRGGSCTGVVSPPSRPNSGYRYNPYPYNYGNPYSYRPYPYYYNPYNGYHYYSR